MQTTTPETPTKATSGDPQAITGAQRRNIRTIARNDAMHLYRSCEDAITMSYTDELDRMADDAISMAAPDLDDDQITAARPIYLAAFWRAWNDLDEPN